MNRSALKPGQVNVLVSNFLQAALTGVAALSQNPAGEITVHRTNGRKETRRLARELHAEEDWLKLLAELGCY